MLRLTLSILCLCCVSTSYAGGAGVPGTLAHQGVIAVHGQRFTGQGLFRFALVNTTNNTYLWTNDGSTPPPPDSPTNSVPVAVINGVYNIQLGDDTDTNMTTIPPAVFTDNERVALRIWFDDDVNGLHEIAPDQPISAVPFAQHSANSATTNDNAITSAKIADGQVTNADIANNAVTGNKIEDETITAADLSNNAVNSAKIQDESVTAADLATNSVDSDEIVIDAVTSAKIASDAASLDRVSGGTMSAVAGNVGIGTASPLSRLHVLANGGDMLKLETPLPSGQSGVSMAFTRMGSVKKRIELTANDDLSIFQGNGGNDTVANRTFMTLNSNTGETVFSGNVGIGTTAPEAKLDVDGHIQSNRYAFYAGRSGGDDPIGPGYTPIPYDNPISDDDSVLTTEGAFVAPVTGKYFVSTTVSVRSLSGVGVAFRFLVDGTPAGEEVVTWAPAGENNAVTWSAVLNVTNGQTVQPAAKAGTPVDARWRYFLGYYLGR